MSHEENSSCCGTSEKKFQEVKKKKCCQTDPEIKVCGCKSKKEKKNLFNYFSGLFREKKD